MSKDQMLASVLSANQSITAAAVGSCTCGVKSGNPAHHAADCRWLKLVSALEDLDSIYAALCESETEAR